MQQILIGTNSLDTLYDIHVEGDVEPNPAFSGYSAVLKILSARHKQRYVETLGRVTLGSDSAETVPAGGTVVVDGVVYLTSCFPENVALIGCSELSNLPSGLIVASGLHTLPNKWFFHVPVLLKNKTHTDILISPKTVLAEMYSVQQVMEVPQRGNTSQVLAESTKPQINIDYGDSPLPSEWKNRISALLNEIPDVFSLHDMDYGHTDKVKHRIKLSNETPFKHRPRPVHPHDVSAVRKHLQELLNAGNN